MKSVYEFLGLLKGVKPTGKNRWVALCPAHNDRNPSLSVKALPDKILVSCQAGCHINAVLAALKIEMSDLFFDSHKAKSSTLSRKIVATYDYLDENGKLLHQTVRYEPKEFRQRRPGKRDKWIWSLKGITPVIYHLPRVKEAIDKGETIFLTEGEKDADNLISQFGLVATTNPMGARKWREGYTQILTGAKEVIVIADSDSPGQLHAREIAASLVAAQIPTKILDMPSADITDISDWISSGLTIEQFNEIIENLPPKPIQRSYLLINDKGRVTGVDTKALVDDLLTDFIFKTIFGFIRDDILIYEKGIYTSNGEKVIREECEIRVGVPWITTHLIHEIRDRIGGQTFIDREQFNTEKYIINVENGLLDVKTRKLIQHTPAFLSTLRIPIAYDSQAKCPKIQVFLDSILRPEDVKVILEFFGYALIPDYSIPVVLILLGEGSNGKTQLLHLLGRFIGQGNYISVSLQDIENNSFAVASLEGKLLNMQGDLSSRWLSGVGMLKQLSGQDRITANRKYKDPLQFDNFARLVFASNRPPKIEENTLAVWRRILPIDLPNIFQGEKDIKNYIDTILTPQELSGLLNLALDGLQQILSKGDFSYQGSYSDRSRQYTIASDPAKAFVEERCDIGTEFKILKEELYENYAVFCDEHRVQLSGDSQFAKELRQVPGLSISDKQYQEKGVRVRWWLGVQLKGKEEKEELREPPPEQIDMEV